MKVKEKKVLGKGDNVTAIKMCRMGQNFLVALMLDERTEKDGYLANNFSDGDSSLEVEFYVVDQYGKMLQEIKD